jgi:outer membrane autotransporter protein
LSANGTTVTSTSRIEPVLISDANIIGGIPNATITVVNPVGGPGLIVQNTNCCAQSIPGVFDQPVVAAQSGGTVNLGNGTTAIGLGSATINPNSPTVNYVLSALAENLIARGNTPAVITGENVTVIAKDGAGTPPIVAIISDGFGSTPTTIPMIRLSGLTLTANTASTATGLLALDGGQITIMPPPQGGMSQLMITGSAGATGMALVGGGTINLNNAIMTVTGAPGNTEGIFVDGPVGTTATVNLNDSTVNSNGLGILTEGGGTLNFMANHSNLTGAAITMGNSISNVTLENGTVWNMTGDSNLTNLTNSASTIQFSPPVGGAFKTLTTVNYVGAGGTLGLNTFLGADNSPSDRLVINGGTATGSSFVRITNAGGPGTETTGNGILMVNAINGATTAPGAFTLAGEVRAGAYDYDLFRGGISGSDPNDWFLRSSFIVGPPPLPGQPEPEPFPPGVLPPDPPLGPLPPGIYPIIGPEIATDGVVQPIARQLGLTTLGTLHERAGDTLEGSCGSAVSANTGAPAGAAPAATDGRCKPGLWGRVFGQSINNSYQAFADPRAVGQIAGIQTGFDFFRGSLIPGHSDTAGIYLSYANAHVDVDGLVTNPAATAYVISRTGTVGMNAYSGGAYWTHYGPSGWYIDAVVQGTGYDGSATTQFANLPITGSGVVTSLEAGYPIPLPWFGPRFAVEPQGQVIWQQVSFSEANDGLGPVGLGTTSGTTGRLGLRGQWTIADANGMVWRPYVRANVWRDWGAEATTTFGIDQAPLIEQATRVEFAGGVTAKLGTSLSVFAQGGYQFATSESGANGFRRDSIKGDIGVRYTW